MNKTSLIVQVLGTAQDAGYPQLGCSCPNCRHANTDNRLKRLPSSLGLFDLSSKKSYIIDATPAFPEQLTLLNAKAEELGFPNDHLAGIFLTHAHLGHYCGLMFLGKEALNTNRLPVFCTKPMLDFLQNNAPWSDLIQNENILPKTFNPGEEIILNHNHSFQGVSIPHRNEHADTVGFVVKSTNKSIFYLPDLDAWHGFEEQFNQVVAKVDIAFLDGTFFDKNELKALRDRSISEVPHPPISDTIKLFQNQTLKANSAQIFFTHFNHTNDVLSLNQETIRYIENAGFKVLAEGMQFSL